MTRPLRLEYPGAVYHVTSRGNARADIYLDDADRAEFLAIFSDTVKRYNWLCHAYCLMDNHYHLLIETIEPNLSLGMRHLNGVYTQNFNRRHDRVGHIFQGRFKSIIVEKGPHLLELCRYIVLNPIKAGMVKTTEEWPWSSYLATAGISKAADFLTCAWLWRQFAGKRAEAIRRYLEFVREASGPGGISPWEKLQGQIFFGGKQFVSKMQEKLGEKKQVGEIPRAQRHPGRPSLPELFDKAATKGERNMKIAAAHQDYAYTMQQIARHLGIHYTTVSRAVKRARSPL